jgi:rhodanese-related sulfurtransferase
MSLEDCGTDWEISSQQLKALWEQNPALVVLDCRTAAELRVASLPGTLHIPMSEIPGRLNELEPDVDTVVICHHGVRSLQVTRWLRSQAGYSRVKSLSGGVDAWSVSIDPTVPRY